MPRRGRTRTLTRAALLATAGLLALSACGGEQAGPKLELSAALPDSPSDGTVLRVGDPATQVALETSGLIDDLDIDVEWANITGGPKTLEAFRADAIDIGSVADIPPLFAHWTGTDVRIVAARETVDPMEHPTYELGVAPGVDVKSIEDLEGKKIATSYPRLVRAHLARSRVRADIIKLDGAVEISVQLNLADAIADVVSSGRTLRQHNLVAFGDPIAESEATLIEREPRPDREETVETKQEKVVFTERLRGVVYARKFLMVDYDCPQHALDAAKAVAPGMQAPTVSKLQEEGWFGVRTMVLKREANRIMDELANIGARAILTSEIRSCRAVDGRQ